MDVNKLDFTHLSSQNESITVDLPQIFCLIVAITTLDIFFFPIRGLFVGMFIQNQPPIMFLNYIILNILILRMMLEPC